MAWAAALLSLTLVQASTLTRDQTRELIQAISDALTNGYIYEEVAQRVARVLEEKRVEGAFEQVKNAEELATRLTTVLQTETKDRHLVVAFRVDAHTSVTAPDTPAAMVGRVEVLPQNIGYIEVRHFASPNGSEFDTAMEALKDVRALIIDLGRNPGALRDGSVAAARFSNVLTGRPHLRSANRQRMGS
jgi:retinol-binding protein 3